MSALADTLEANMRGLLAQNDKMQTPVVLSEGELLFPKDVSPADGLWMIMDGEMAIGSFRVVEGEVGEATMLPEEEVVFPIQELGTILDGMQEHVDSFFS